MKPKHAIKQFFSVFVAVAIVTLLVSCPSNANEDYEYNPLLGTWSSYELLTFTDDQGTMFSDYVHIAFSQDTVIFYAPSVGSTEALPYTYSGDYSYTTIQITEGNETKEITKSNDIFTGLGNISVLQDLVGGSARIGRVDSDILLTPGVPSPEENVSDYVLYLDRDMTGYVVKEFKSDAEIPSVIDNLPTEYNGYPVVGIGPMAFKGPTQVNNVTTKIIIPESIISFTSSAFSHCNWLEEIVINSSVIPENAFENCGGTITFGDNVKEIGSEAFAGLGIEELVLPEGLEIIGSRAFAESNLKKLTIPASVKEIGPAAFSGCENLTELNVEVISDANILNGALAGYPYFESYVVPEGTTIIPGGAFEDCTGLKSVTIPSSVKEIGSNAFSGCTALEEIDISSVTTLGYESIFEGCTNLKKVTLSDELKEVPLDCFRDCTNLVEINFPANLELINSYAFMGCSNFVVPELPRNVSTGISAFNGTGVTEVTIRKDIEYGGGTFSGCKNLVKVVIEDGVEEIEDSTFYGCESLKEVEFPSSLRIIGSWSFSNCTSLEEVILPDNLYEIEMAAFIDSTNIKEITIPSSVRYMGHEVFVDWTADQTINVPFAENNLPRNWNSNWNARCDAVINYQ